MCECGGEGGGDMHVHVNKYFSVCIHNHVKEKKMYVHLQVCVCVPTCACMHVCVQLLLQL